MKGSFKATCSFLLLMLFCGCSRSGEAAGPGIPDLRGTESLTAARLIGNVRKSVGYQALAKLRRGFTVEEVRTDQSSPAGFVYSFGPKGKARRQSTSSNPDPFVFDVLSARPLPAFFALPFTGIGARDRSPLRALTALGIFPAPARFPGR